MPLDPEQEVKTHHSHNPPPATTTTQTQLTDLAGVIKELMLKLLDTKDLLEHFIQLVFAEDELRGGARRHPLLVLPGVFFLATVDSVELCHPGAQNRLFAEAVDLRQAADPLLNVLLENLARVIGRAAAALHHPAHAVTF